MKKILFLLLCTVQFYGQTSTGQEQSFPYGIVNESLQTITTPTYIGTFGTDGTQGKIPSAYIAKTASVQDSLNKKLNLPTGFLQGLQLSINADPTKFNIAAGYYVVTDFTNLTQPVVKIINYAGATGLTPAYLATANSTYVALDKNQNVISSAYPFSDAKRRTLAIIGNVVHSNRTNINIVNEIKAPIVAVGNQLHDFMKAIGFLNESGNVYSANGANLQINKSVGDIFGMGINASDYLSPHKLTIPSQTALTFAYRFQNGTQLADTQNINPNIYDVGGTSTATPSNKWTIQRINLFQSGLSRIQPGQTVYNSFNDAVVALPTQPFVTEQNIADNAVFRCYLIIQQGTTNLASAVAGGSAQFVPVDKFGNIIGNGSVALTYSNIVAALGFTPENIANKSDSYTASSSTTYASTKALVDGLATKIGGSGTTNTIPKFTASGTVGNSSITDNGTIVTTSTDMSVNGLTVGRGGSNVAFNTGVGSNVLNSNTGNYNTAIGYRSLYSNLGGSYNTAIGMYSQYLNTTANNNVSFGVFSLYGNNGSENLGFGYQSGRYITDGVTSLSMASSSIFVGSNTKALSNSQTNQIVIGANSTGLGSNTAVLGNSSTVQTWVGGRLTVGSTVDDGTNSLQLTGTAKLSTTPTTSAGTYDILTRNTSTGVVEKVASSIISSKWTQTGSDIRNSNTGNVLLGASGTAGYYPTSRSILGSWVNGSFSSSSIGIRQDDYSTDGVAMYINSEQAYIYGGTTRNMNVGTLKTDGVINASINSVNKTITSNTRFELLVPIKLKNYTVATLPTGTQGDTAYVTDALAPTYLTTIVGGGAVVCPVFYNGTAWVSH